MSPEEQAHSLGISGVAPSAVSAESAPSTAVTLYAPPRVPRPKRVARSRIARLVAEGRTTAEIAREVGYSRQHVWRLVRNSMPMQQAVDEADARVDFDSTGRLLGVRPVVADELARQASEGNVRVLLWLANKLKVADVSAPVKSRAEKHAWAKGR